MAQGGGPIVEAKNVFKIHYSLPVRERYTGYFSKRDCTDDMYVC